MAAPRTESHGVAALSLCISDDVPGDDGCIVLRLYSLSGREYNVTSKRRCAFRLIKTPLIPTDVDQLKYFGRDGRELFDKCTVREAGPESGDVVHFCVDAEDHPPPLCFDSDSDSDSD